MRNNRLSPRGKSGGAGESPIPNPVQPAKGRASGTIRDEALAALYKDGPPAAPPGWQFDAKAGGFIRSGEARARAPAPAAAAAAQEADGPTFTQLAGQWLDTVRQAEWLQTATTWTAGPAGAPPPATWQQHPPMQLHSLRPPEPEECRLTVSVRVYTFEDSTIGMRLNRQADGPVYVYEHDQARRQDQLRVPVGADLGASARHPSRPLRGGGHEHDRRRRRGCSTSRCDSMLTDRRGGPAS